MIEVLVGLIVATVLIYCWFRGFAIAALFITLLDLFAMTFTGQFRYPDIHTFLFLGVSIVVIWLPFYLQQDKFQPKPAKFVVPYPK